MNRELRNFLTGILMGIIPFVLLAAVLRPHWGRPPEPLPPPALSQSNPVAPPTTPALTYTGDALTRLPTNFLTVTRSNFIHVNDALIIRVTDAQWALIRYYLPEQLTNDEPDYVSFYGPVAPPKK